MRAGRHSALGDARVLWEFVKRIYREKEIADIESAVRRLLRIPSLPPQLAPDALENLPLSPESLIAVRTPVGDDVPAIVEDWLCRHRLRRFGSTALHLCYAAMGGLDLVYDHQASLWDLAGAAPVLLEGGGVLTRADGAPVFPITASDRDGSPVTILAGNSISHAQALSDVTASAMSR